MEFEPLESISVLARKAQAGSRAAFGALYERFTPYVFSILLARLSRDEAHDLVQEVFVTALERLPSLREPAAFPGWIAAIARNRAIDQVKTRRPHDELVDSASAVGSPELQARAHEALRAIRRLPEAYQETLLLRLVQGLTGPEIAEMTGLTPESVRVNLHRGFKLLREQLGETK